MMIIPILQKAAQKSIEALYGLKSADYNFQINETKPEFEGDYTIVLFALLKTIKKSPEQLGQEIGTHIVENNKDVFIAFNVIKGFLNLTVADSFYTHLLNRYYNDICYAKKEMSGKKVMVEYSSPNTNKPLHLGHLRNNFLGWSIAEIYKANGYEVIKSCIVNDRGVHICKSMIAWQRFGNGATPQSTSTKGDHFVGDYYVMFENELKKQANELLTKESENIFTHYNDLQKKQFDELLLKRSEYELKKTKEDIEKYDKVNDDFTMLRRSSCEIMMATNEMLNKWEQNDAEVIELWKTMNGWVYEGFDATYKKIGTDFDKIYYESNTYLLGKDTVEEGLTKSIFYKRSDGSVWIDLTKDGLDEKLVLRKDGTSVYMTQDIGLAQQKYDQYKIDSSIYVIGNEQDYHMAVLKLICQKLGLPYANDIYHLSYGMVELPTGKMKSREGTVVDADDIVADMIQQASDETAKHGKTDDFNETELKDLYNTIGLGAMKFFLLRVDPKKKMIFNPEESIEFQGFTGPFIQYTHARIKSILRKNNFTTSEGIQNASLLLKLEKSLLVILEQYQTILEQACAEHNPSVIAIYAFEVAKVFNSFYAEHSVNNAETEEKKQLRLLLCSFTANVLKSCMQLLGAAVPERM
jgi:arginyl-tRNA synthetase